MSISKKLIVTSFALFSLFFGAGNLILPPLLGFTAGSDWWLVVLGFCITAVIIPLLGIFAHAKLQGSIYDFGKKVSHHFSLVYAFLIYAISVTLPGPRTAAVTHEMVIQPFLDIPIWGTSMVYYLLVFLFVINRTRVLNMLGKLLTPIIFCSLLLLIGTIVYSYSYTFNAPTVPNVFTYGILEGYQTFDAIGAVVVGGVIIVSIAIENPEASYLEKKQLLTKAGWVAGLGLLLMYAGLILAGALVAPSFSAGITRTELLSGMATVSLGSMGNICLSLLIGLACFTTAVGIVTGTADYVKLRSSNSHAAYVSTAAIACLLGVLMGQFNVADIITIALPVLLLIYPVTIMLIVLNVIPDRYSMPSVHKTVIITTLLFSVPDFLQSIGVSLNPVTMFLKNIPLQAYNLGWVLPAVISFVLANLIRNNNKA